MTGVEDMRTSEVLGVDVFVITDCFDLKKGIAIEAGMEVVVKEVFMLDVRMVLGTHRHRKKSEQE
jgi:hypothetical protein